MTEPLKLNAYSKCGACKVYVRDPLKGCEICGPFKEVVVSKPGSDAVNAGRAALELLEAQLADLRRERARRESDPKCVGTYDPKLWAAELNCAKALSILLEHIRKQVKKESAEYEEIGPEEKLEAFLDMVEQLPDRLHDPLFAGMRARGIWPKE